LGQVMEVFAKKQTEEPWARHVALLQLAKSLSGLLLGETAIWGNGGFLRERLVSAVRRARDGIGAETSAGRAFDEAFVLVDKVKRLLDSVVKEAEEEGGIMTPPPEPKAGEVNREWVIAVRRMGARMSIGLLQTGVHPTGGWNRASLQGRAWHWESMGRRSGGYFATGDRLLSLAKVSYAEGDHVVIR